MKAVSIRFSSNKKPLRDIKKENDKMIFCFRNVTYYVMWNG